MKESPPSSSNNPWISRHSFFVIGIVVMAGAGLFLNKAIHADDPLFIWTAQWIQRHPADFYGFKVNWWVSAVPMYNANQNPPGMCYLLAAAGAALGWEEIALHAVGMAIAFAGAAGIYRLAQRWCERPWLATIIAILTPVFLVSNTTLMCDGLMLAFWIWAVVAWELAMESGKRWLFAGAGVLAGLAVLTKYSALTLLPLLPVLSLLRIRKVSWWVLWLAVPLLMAAAYEWMTARMYGIGGFAGAAAYAHEHGSTFAEHWLDRGLIGLAFAGGSLLPVLLFAPLTWRWQAWLGGGAAIIAGLLALVATGTKIASQAAGNWSYLLQGALLAAGGVQLVLLAGAEVWKRRDTVSVALAAWIACGMFFAVVLNWTVSARNFLPLVPAAEEGIFEARSWWPLVPAAVVAFSLALADARAAGEARTAAEDIIANDKPAGHTLWFEGHWGFAYYLEKGGGQPVDCEQSRLQPGDVVAVAIDGNNLVWLPPGSAGWVGRREYAADSWINPSAGAPGCAGGFYSANLAPLPFVIGRPPAQTYCIVKVLSGIQYRTKPANEFEIQTGRLPVFTNLAFTVEDSKDFPETPAAAGNVQLATQYEKSGDMDKAIQSYRQALATDTNDMVALNNLAWDLATASRSGTGDQQEAVRLASRAVELSERRIPVFIGTLAAAYAANDQFSQAVETAQTAHDLAIITGQPEVAAANLKLRALYTAGKTANVR